MMSKFAVVVMMPDSVPGILNFTSREFNSWEEFSVMMTEFDAVVPDWQIVTLCHIEDLPRLMLPLPGAEGEAA